MADQYGSREERRKAQKKGDPKKRGLFKKIFLTLCIVFFLVLAAGGVFTLAAIYNAPKLTPELLDSPLSTTMYDKNDKAKATLYHKEKRIKIDIKDVPQTMKDAVISVEDRRFNDHFGIDIRRIIGAAITDIKEGRLAEGGSTITQQVIKRVALSANKTFTRKIQGAYLAIKLEQHYSKDQILEMYLNNIFYGEGAYGLATAAETFFGTKNISDLNLSQKALLAGLPNAPTAYDPYIHPKRAAQRRDKVLSAMVETGAITSEQEKKAKSKKIKDLHLVNKKKANKNNSEAYEAFVDTVYHQLVEEKKVVSHDEFFQGGLKIYTTLDSSAQKKVHNLMKSDKVDYPDKYFNVGITLMDTQSGAVRAVGGGRNFQSIGDYNYGSQITRPPGSTFKPVMDYGPAIEYLKWSTYHPIVDEPYHYKDTKQTPIHDWDGKYEGKMTLRRALARSRNIPALKTFYAVGSDKAGNFAKSLGIHFKNGDIPDASAIGSFDPGASPMQMAGAFAAFGNQGVYHEPYTVRKVVFPNGKTIKLDHKPKEVMHDYTAYMVTDMLKSVVKESYGTGTAANVPGLPMAGKTGSVGLDGDFKKKFNISDSGALSDEWFTGYTTQYTLSVWTGYPSLKTTEDGKDEVHYIGGHENSKVLSRTMFRQLMSEVSSDDVADFKMPNSVEELTVEKNTGMLASENTPNSEKITELFVKGNGPTEVSHKYQKVDAPKGLKAEYDEKTKLVTATWEEPNNNDINFEIDVSINGKPQKTVGPTKDHEFVVDGAEPGSVYHFKVTAVDDKTDQRSDPAETEIKVPEKKEVNEKPETPKAFHGDYDKDSRQITLNWVYPGRGKNIGYEVAFSKDGQPMQTVGTTGDNQFAIPNAEPDSNYRFTVIAVNNKTGQRSDPAETTVTVPPEKNDDQVDDDDEDHDNGNGHSDRDDNGDDGNGNDGSGQINSDHDHNEPPDSP